MNEYSVITYAFKQNHIKEVISEGKLTKDFHCISEPKDLYDYVRIEDIEKISSEAGLERIKLIAADGPADYLRPVLNSLDEESYQLFIDYHLATCERKELLGASAHTLDILKNTK